MQPCQTLPLPPGTGSSGSLSSTLSLFLPVSAFFSCVYFSAHPCSRIHHPASLVRLRSRVSFTIPRLCGTVRLSAPTSVMSGIITGPYFKQFFNSPGPLEVGTMVAVLELGALGTSIPFTIFPSSPLEATSIAAGRVGDIIGRRGTLLVGAFVFTIGGAVQTFTTGFYVMIIGRVISGFGVGLLS